VSALRVDHNTQRGCRRDSEYSRRFTIETTMRTKRPDNSLKSYTAFTLVVSSNSQLYYIGNMCTVVIGVVVEPYRVVDDSVAPGIRGLRVPAAVSSFGQDDIILSDELDTYRGRDTSTA